MSAKNYWLVKSEPSTYAWDNLVRDKRTRWDGVRNFEARNNLRAMKKGDVVLYYHSGGDSKEIVGIATVAAEAYADPSATEGDWSVVDLTAKKALARPVSLAALKQDKVLSQMAVVRKPRISVVPVLPDEFDKILELTGTQL